MRRARRRAVGYVGGLTSEPAKTATEAMPAAADRGGEDAVSIFYDFGANAAGGLRGDRNPATPEFIGQNDQST
jgi:hypothetical protein